MKPTVVDVEDVRDRVDAVLDKVLAGHRQALAQVDPASVAMLDAIAGLIEGGKRLRAAFCYWGWRGAGGGDEDHAPLIAAAALEMFQMAALIHDDVIDESDTRRGNPTIHRTFAERHCDGAHWHGDADRFGLAVAVLAGDLCLSWSNELMGQIAVTGVPLQNWRDARRMYDLMSTQLMAGQYLDVHEQAEALGTVQRALHVIRYKSAKYTIEHPLLIGGSLAGAEPAVLQTYSNFAVPLGEAFQLRDDLLGVFGDPAQTGKPSGDDLREGKRTVLVALAGSSCTPAQRQRLQECLVAADPTQTQIDDARDILSASGAVAQVEQMIERRVAEATGALENGVLELHAKDVLAQLVSTTTQRAA